MHLLVLPSQICRVHHPNLQLGKQKKVSTKPWHSMNERLANEGLSRLPYDVTDNARRYFHLTLVVKTACRLLGNAVPVEWLLQANIGDDRRDCFDVFLSGSRIENDNLLISLNP